MIDLFWLYWQFKEPMIVLLLASGLVSVAMGQYDDAVSITVVSMVSTKYKLKEGGEYGHANPLIPAFFSPNPSICQYFCSNPKTTTTSGNRSINVQR